MLAGNSFHWGHTVKKLPIIATMLLLMGTIVLPACDESKGTDPLALAALFYSQYYLEFDADYDNDGNVDEHVKMKMRYPFNYIADDDWYQGHFENHYYHLSINIPDTTIGPIIYTEPNDYFRFGYRYNDIEYGSQDDHDFTFNIIRWDGIGGEIYAEFEGEISDDYAGDEHIADIYNGKCFARIIK
jgi:hypothetical protein